MMRYGYGDLLMVLLFAQQIGAVAVEFRDGDILYTMGAPPP